VRCTWALRTRPSHRASTFHGGDRSAIGVIYDRFVGNLDFFRSQIRSAWDWLETTVSDVTEAMANWWPPGTANSIGATYLHVVINPDVELNRLLYGAAPLIEREWAGDVGQGVAYDPDRFDDWVRGAAVDWLRL